MCEHDPMHCDCHEWAPKDTPVRDRVGSMFSIEESYRLHRAHCTGCSEYRNHAGTWGRVDDPKTVQRAVAGNAGFDSPPPPPSTFPAGFPRYCDGCGALRFGPFAPHMEDCAFYAEEDLTTLIHDCCPPHADCRDDCDGMCECC